LTIWLDTMLEAEELPAGVTNLDTALSDMNIDDFSHIWWCFKKNKVLIINKTKKCG